MADRLRSASMEDLPLHIVLDILTSGRLSAVDSVCLELTSLTFRGNRGFFPEKFRSLVDFAAFRLCEVHPLYSSLRLNSQQEVVNRCSGNWKQLLRFLQSVDESSALVETSAGNQMQIKSGRYHTLLIKNSAVYSCGSSLCGVLGQGPETAQSMSFSRLCFPAPAQVMHMSASHNHAAFVTLFEQCQGLNSVAKDISCGTDAHGQLGHGDTIYRPIGRMKMMFSTLPTLKKLSRAKKEISCIKMVLKSILMLK